MNSPLALQGARDHIGRARQHIAGLRAGLKQASVGVAIPGGGIIVTPALSGALSNTHKVRDLHVSQHLLACAAVIPLWLPCARCTILHLQMSDGVMFWLADDSDRGGKASCVQGLECIGLDMQAADTEHSFSSKAPTWAYTLAIVHAAIEEGRDFVKRQDAAHRPASLGSSVAAQTEWEAALERAVTSVLLWAQSASKAPGA